MLISPNSVHSTSMSQAAGTQYVDLLLDDPLGTDGVICVQQIVEGFTCRTGDVDLPIDICFPFANAL